jgi:hypothetical protein
MNSYLWPDNPLEFSCNDPAADVGHPAYCCLDWMKDYFGTDGVLSACFAQAADRIIENRLSKPQSNSDDGLFMPVAYLYRHSIELNIKELIRFFISTGDLKESKNLRDLLQRSHSLSKLWSRIEQLLRGLANNEADSATDHVASFLSRLDACDPGGTSMRYSRSHNGSSSSDLYPDRVNLVMLRDSVRSVNNFLRGSLDYVSSRHEQ